MLREWFYEKTNPSRPGQKMHLFCRKLYLSGQDETFQGYLFFISCQFFSICEPNNFLANGPEYSLYILDIYLSSAAYYFGLSPSKSFLYNPWFHNSLTGSKNYHHCWSPPNHHFLISVISCSYSYSCSI